MDTRKEIESSKKQLLEVSSSGQDQADQQKYEVLFLKDQEMSRFLETFPQQFGEEKQRVSEKQQEVMRMLEDVSRYLGQEQNLDQVGADMQDELQFKETQLAQSESTNAKLVGQVEKRKNELEKIQNLDGKISQELAQLDAKMQQ